MKDGRLLTWSKFILMGIGAIVVLGFALKLVGVLFGVLLSSLWGLFGLLKVVLLVAGIAFLLYCFTNRGACRRHSRYD